MDKSENNERAVAELEAAQMKSEAEDLVWTLFIRYAVTILLSERLSLADKAGNPEVRATVIDGFRRMVNTKINQDMRQAREVLETGGVEGMMLDLLGGGGLLKKAEALAVEIHDAAENMIDTHLRVSPKEDPHA